MTIGIKRMGEWIDKGSGLRECVNDVEYFISDPKEAWDDTDKLAAQLCIEHGDTIEVGSTIAWVVYK